ncbi:MAG: hypothetical protein GXP03_11135 [Alphaproteobacteria bacterium]|nr:hypothetical protein [Alphaproteobacteria bacterium]
MSKSKQNEDGAPAQFLDLKSYRQKRMLDAAKLLPLAGALVFLFPLVYLFVSPHGPISPGITAIYFFVIWLVLILLTRFLAPRMQATIHPASKSD